MSSSCWTYNIYHYLALLFCVIILLDIQHLPLSGPAVLCHHPAGHPTFYHYLALLFCVIILLDIQHFTIIWPCCFVSPSRWTYNILPLSCPVVLCHHPAGHPTFYHYLVLLFCVIILLDIQHFTIILPCCFVSSSCWTYNILPLSCPVVLCHRPAGHTTFYHYLALLFCVIILLDIQHFTIIRPCCFVSSSCWTYNILPLSGPTVLCHHPAGHTTFYHYLALLFCVIILLDIQHFTIILSCCFVSSSCWTYNILPLSGPTVLCHHPAGHTTFYHYLVLLFCVIILLDIQHFTIILPCCFVSSSCWTYNILPLSCPVVLCHRPAGHTTFYHYLALLFCVIILLDIQHFTIILSCCFVSPSCWTYNILPLSCPVVLCHHPAGHTTFYHYPALLFCVIILLDIQRFTIIWPCCFVSSSCWTYNILPLSGPVVLCHHPAGHTTFYHYLALLFCVIILLDIQHFTIILSCCFVSSSCWTYNILPLSCPVVLCHHPAGHTTFYHYLALLFCVIILLDIQHFTIILPCCFVSSSCWTYNILPLSGPTVLCHHPAGHTTFYHYLVLLFCVIILLDIQHFTIIWPCCFVSPSCWTYNILPLSGPTVLCHHPAGHTTFYHYPALLFCVIILLDIQHFTIIRPCCFVSSSCWTYVLPLSGPTVLCHHPAGHATFRHYLALLFCITILLDIQHFTIIWPCCFVSLSCWTYNILPLSGPTVLCHHPAGHTTFRHYLALLFCVIILLDIQHFTIILSCCFVSSSCWTYNILPLSCPVVLCHHPAGHTTFYHYLVLLFCVIVLLDIQHFTIILSCCFVSSSCWTYNVLPLSGPTVMCHHPAGHTMFYHYLVLLFCVIILLDIQHFTIILSCCFVSSSCWTYNILPLSCPVVLCHHPAGHTTFYHYLALLFCVIILLDIQHFTIILSCCFVSSSCWTYNILPLSGPTVLCHHPAGHTTFYHYLVLLFCVIILLDIQHFTIILSCCFVSSSCWTYNILPLSCPVVLCHHPAGHTTFYHYPALLFCVIILLDIQRFTIILPYCFVSSSCWTYNILPLSGPAVLCHHPAGHTTFCHYLALLFSLDGLCILFCGYLRCD